MILILEQTTNEIIGADKDFLKHYSLEELNKKFNNNLELIEKYFFDYKIEKFPIKDYLFLILEEKETIEPLVIDENLLTPEPKQEKIEEVEKPEITENLLDTSLFNDIQVEEPTIQNEPPKTEEKIEETNSINLDNLLIDEPLLTAEPKQEKIEEVEKPEITKNLLDTSLFNDIQIEEPTIQNEPPKTEEKIEETNSINLDNLLIDEPLLTAEPKQEKIEEVEKPEITKNLLDTSLFNDIQIEEPTIQNEPPKTEVKNNEISISDLDKTLEDNITNLDSSNDKPKEKTVIKLNFDIESIKRKKQNK